MSVCHVVEVSVSDSTLLVLKNLKAYSMLQAKQQTKMRQV
jgi:hypothetical protein